MSLVRTAFWLCVVIMLVPTGSGNVDSENESGDEGRGLAALALGAAQVAVTDLISICDRNPDVCETGTLALERFGQKAASVAGTVYRAVSDAPSSSGEAPKPRRMEASQPGASSAANPVTDTLGPSDVETPWQGPDLGDA